MEGTEPRSLFQILDEELLPRLSVEDAYPDVVYKARRGRYWRGGCPLHGGTDPNFSVDTQTLSWACFSHCGHGSYLAYLNGGESPRGARFVELVRVLAEQVGVQIDEREASPEQVTAARRRALLEGLVARAGEALYEPVGRRVVEYLAGRGFPADPAELVRLGFGAHPGSAGLGQLRAPTDELRAAGLADPRWTGRLLIPWRDDYGRIETIAARTLDDSEPRYLYLANASLPPFYRPGRRTTRETIAPLVIVEGFLDGIALRWAGVPNVVATGGTALNQRHVEVLAAGSERTLVLAFDADEAGRTATRRLVALLHGAGVDRHIRAVPFEAFRGTKDPAELVARDGIDDAAALVRAAVPWLVSEAMHILREVAPDSPVALRRDALDALERLAVSACGVDREADLEDVARMAVEATGYSDAVVKRALGLAVKGDLGPQDPSSAVIAPTGSGAVRDPVADEVVRILTAIGAPVRIMTLVHMLRGADSLKALQLIEEHSLTGLPSRVLPSMTHSAYRRCVLASCDADDRIRPVGPASLGLASSTAPEPAPKPVRGPELRPEPKWPRAGEPWTREEEDQLCDEWAQQLAQSAIARRHGRSGRAIWSRLSVLGLVEWTPSRKVDPSSTPKVRSTEPALVVEVSEAEVPPRFVYLWRSTFALLDEVFEGRFPDGSEPVSNEAVWAVVDDLGARPAVVVSLRYGRTGAPQTLEETAVSIAREGKPLSRERIRQIQKKALRFLRHPSRKRRLFMPTETATLLAGRPGGAPHPPMDQLDPPAREPNTGAKWATVDELLFASLWMAGRRVVKMAEVFGRTEGAMIAKAVDVGLARDRETARKLANAPCGLRAAAAREAREGLPIRHE